MVRGIKDRVCPNLNCKHHGESGEGNIVPHGFFKSKTGKRRRYRCTSCGRTFSSNTGTAYHRIQYSRESFDHVVLLSVEGVSRSTIARTCGLAPDTVARWLERAASIAAIFNDQHVRDFELHEMQADEIRTFVHAKKNVRWIFAAMEVSSRLWTSTVTGRRSYRSVGWAEAPRQTSHERGFAFSDDFGKTSRRFRQNVSNA